MTKPNVMISGPLLSRNILLQLSLQDDNRILVLYDTNALEQVFKTCKVDLLLLELTEEEIIKEILEGIQLHYPGLPIIVFNGNGSNQSIAQAFLSGAKDSFRIKGLLDSNHKTTSSPIKVICNRVRSLINQCQKTTN